MDIYRKNELTYNDIINSLIDLKDESESVTVAIKMKDGTVQTAYYNNDFGTKQELIGHLQADVIDQMILANLDDRYR